MRNTRIYVPLAAIAAAALSGSACNSVVDVPAGVTSPAPPGPAVARNVSVNGARIGTAELLDLEHRYRLRFVDGDYWYDPKSGACGAVGGPIMAFIIPGLALGGELATDVSAGNTGVFINGRELPQYDLVALTRLIGFVVPGRYFLDGNGNAGFEGGPPLANLIAASRQAQQSGGAGRWYSTQINATGGQLAANGYVVGRDDFGNSWVSNK